MTIICFRICYAMWTSVTIDNITLIGAHIYCMIDDGNGQVCISEIVPGSIAHRSGTLKISDTLLAVNNKSLSDCTRQEASSILQEAGDVVTLRVRTSNTAIGNIYL